MQSRLKLGYVSSKSGLITFMDECDLELEHHGEAGTPSEDYAFQLSAGMFTLLCFENISSLQCLKSIF